MTVFLKPLALVGGFVLAFCGLKPIPLAFPFYLIFALSGTALMMYSFLTGNAHSRKLIRDANSRERMRIFSGFILWFLGLIVLFSMAIIYGY